MNQDNTGFGPHLMIDLWDCNVEKLTSQEIVYDLLNTLPAKASMTKMTLPYVCKWLDKFSSGTPGFSGFVMIAESHISIHTFPDQNYVFIDIFSCTEFDVKKAEQILIDVFEAKRSEVKLIKRGKEFARKILTT